MPRFKDHAICIRHLDWSETSQIVTLLTREHGKLRGIAKGARRTSPGAIARYSGGIDLLTGGEVVGIIRPSSDLATLTEWDLQRPYRHLRIDLEAQRMGLYAADVVNALLADHDAHVATFEALVELLEALATATRRATALLRFQWRLLEDAGYRPRVGGEEALNGKPMEGALPREGAMRAEGEGAIQARGESSGETAAWAFDPRAGGVVSAAALVNGGTDEAGPGPWRVRRETVEALRQAAAGAWNQIDDRAADRCNRLLCVYARAIVDRELPTMAMMLASGSGAG